MLSLNTASVADLQKVPGIGPKLEDALCASRPFLTWGDVAKVPMVGPKRLQALQFLEMRMSQLRVWPELISMSGKQIKGEQQLIDAHLTFTETRETSVGLTETLPST